VERAEAQAIFEQGRDVVVQVLLELSAQNARLAQQVEVLTAQVARQEERIAQLERRLKRSSRNSLASPSSDPPSTPPRRGKDSSGRPQGAQPGHEGRGRPLLPAWAVDEVIEHWPDRCGCGRVFDEPVRWQVEELPVISVQITEHRCHRVRCPGCGKRARGKLPSEVSQSAFCPRFQAAVATLSVRNRISRRDVVECCEQLFSSRISTGTVEALLHRAADALTGPPRARPTRVRGPLQPRAHAPSARAARPPSPRRR
jgi:transposase